MSIKSNLPARKSSIFFVSMSIKNTFDPLEAQAIPNVIPTCPAPIISILILSPNFRYNFHYNIEAEVYHVNKYN